MEYDDTKPARETLIDLAIRYGVDVTYAGNNVITKGEINDIMEAERQAMMNENPELFAEMEWKDFLHAMDTLRAKYVDLLSRLTAAARAAYRDVLTKAAVEHLKITMTYERLDGVVNDYTIDPYEYRTRGSEGDLIFAYSEFGEGTRTFLVPSIISLRLTDIHFVPEWEIPSRMQSYYDNNNLADIVIEIEPDIVPDVVELAFPMELDINGVHYSFVDAWALVCALLYLRLDLIDDITAFDRIDGLTLSNLDEYFDPIIADYELWLRLSGFLPPLYVYLFPHGQELWDTLLANHSRMISAIADLADLPWACSVLLNEWFKELFYYDAPDDEILKFWRGSTFVRTGTETGWETTVELSANEHRSTFASYPTERIYNVWILLKHRGLLGL